MPAEARHTACGASALSHPPLLPLLTPSSPPSPLLTARDMALIRPAVHPYADGLFLQLCLAPAAADALRHMPLLQALLPRAQFVD